MVEWLWMCIHEDNTTRTKVMANDPTNQGLAMGQAIKTGNQSGAWTGHDVMHSLCQRTVWNRGIK